MYTGTPGFQAWLPLRWQLLRCPGAGLEGPSEPSDTSQLTPENDQEINETGGLACSSFPTLFLILRAGTRLPNCGPEWPKPVLLSSWHTARLQFPGPLASGSYDWTGYRTGQANGMWVDLMNAGPGLACTIPFLLCSLLLAQCRGSNREVQGPRRWWRIS